MLEREAGVLRFMQGYGDDLLADIEPAEMCTCPKPGLNHPAWIVGHLAYAADGHSVEAGGIAELGDWKDRFGFGSNLTENLADYPSKAELVEAWHAANARLIAAATSADEPMLANPTRGPLAASLPTVADFLAFSMTGHTSLHLGQLSAWRRVMGKPALF
ncbi:MAG: DinB family protein [Planctomycetota bacterium]